MNITKQEIEELLGYKINDFKVQPKYDINGILIDFVINVFPVQKIQFIDMNFKI